MQHLLTFIISMLTALLATPLAIVAGNRFGIIDKPGFRKIHNKPIPFLGGMVIYFSFVLSLLLSGCQVRWVCVLLAVGLFYILFGLLDDAGIKMRARYKIWSHLLFAAAFVYLSGIYIEMFNQELLNWALTIGFIAFMTNSMNMLDGMDGLVTGVSFLAALFFGAVAVGSGQTELLVCCVALMGGCLGFLRFNFTPASIFLGEAGSTFLGFVMAVMAIKVSVFGLWGVALAMGVSRLQLVSFIVPLIILGIPIFDTYFVFANRFLHNIKFSQPGKDHSHHRIHLMGFSQRATVLTLYAIQIVLGLLALALIQSSIQQFVALLLIVAIFFVAFTMLLLKVDVYPHQAAG